MVGVDMKIEDLQGHFKDYLTSEVSAAGLGCVNEVVIKTFNYDNQMLAKFNENKKRCDTEYMVQTHYNQVLEEEAKHDGMFKYLRTMPVINEHLDEDGEFTGKYSIRSRLQFGEVGKAITMDQYRHLIDLGWQVS